MNTLPSLGLDKTGFHQAVYDSSNVLQSIGPLYRNLVGPNLVTEAFVGDFFCFHRVPHQFLMRNKVFIFKI